jgi:hypothetical protein
MKSVLESLSLTSGAILIAMISLGVVWLLCSALPFALRAIWVVLVPLVFAYSLYWLPVWLGADGFAYSVWAIGFVGIWFIAGFFSSAVLVLILQKRRAKRRESAIRLRVQPRHMQNATYRTTGCIGVGCLALYWAAKFVPSVADVLPDSSLGKFVVLGVFLAGAPLTIIAAVRGSRWWWLAVVASAITLWDICVRFSRVLR